MLFLLWWISRRRRLPTSLSQSCEALAILFVSLTICNYKYYASIFIWWWLLYNLWAWSLPKRAKNLANLRASYLLNCASIIKMRKKRRRRRMSCSFKSSSFLSNLFVHSRCFAEIRSVRPQIWYINEWEASSLYQARQPALQPSRVHNLGAR